MQRKMPVVIISLIIHLSLRLIHRKKKKKNIRQLVALEITMKDK